VEGLYDDFLILEFFVGFGGLSVVDHVAVSHLPVAVNCLHNLNVFVQSVPLFNEVVDLRE